MFVGLSQNPAIFALCRRASRPFEALLACLGNDCFRRRRVVLETASEPAKGRHVASLARRRRQLLGSMLSRSVFPGGVHEVG